MDASAARSKLSVEDCHSLLARATVDDHHEFQAALRGDIVAIEADNAGSGHEELWTVSVTGPARLIAEDGVMVDLVAKTKLAPAFRKGIPLLAVSLDHMSGSTARLSYDEPA